MKGQTRFGTKGKLAPRYVGSHEIIEKINLVAYQIALPFEMEHMHNVIKHQIRLSGVDPNDVVKPTTVPYCEVPNCQLLRFWCQPWTIMLTELVAITCSWFNFTLSSRYYSSSLSNLCMVVHLFVYLPKGKIHKNAHLEFSSFSQAYSEMIAERRKKVTDGIEDPFGLRKSQ
ncbi:hypothetical protein HYC85_001999 [Camellia sinensis]|uniref:Uncharacterized protein n=1 Tax=Camellia sinensis TaxID=4442 RepID=A0A7J7I6Y6_CAMSI|nr:hypothetical protein HYC85_001999 [Camellia sinensis]